MQLIATAGHIAQLTQSDSPSQSMLKYVGSEAGDSIQEKESLHPVLLPISCDYIHIAVPALLHNVVKKDYANPASTYDAPLLLPSMRRSHSDRLVPFPASHTDG